MAELIEYESVNHWLCADELPGRVVRKSDHNREARIRLPAPYNKCRKGETEASIQKDVLTQCRTAGYFATRMGVDVHVARTGGDSAVAVANPLKGFPDVFVIESGMFLGIEVKKRGGQLSAQQFNVLEKLIRHGAHVCVALSASGALSFLAGERPNAHIETNSTIKIPLFE